MAEFTEKQPHSCLESVVDPEAQKKLRKMGVNPDGVDIPSLARAALFDKDFPDPPGPVQNGIEEVLDMKLELPAEEIEDMEFEEIISEGEDDDDPITFTEALAALGCLAPPTDARCSENENVTTNSQDEKEALCQLLHGLSLAQKGHEMLASGCERIKTVIARQPSLHKLTGLLQLVKNTDPNLLKAARNNSKVPQTLSSSSIPDIYKPLKMDKSFKCRICDYAAGSWTGCDSHIRKVHTNIMYGTCPKCNVYQSSSYDCYKRHIEKCSPSGNPETDSPAVKVKLEDDS